jgi:hypothetical protein
MRATPSTIKYKNLTIDNTSSNNISSKIFIPKNGIGCCCVYPVEGRAQQHFYIRQNISLPKYQSTSLLKLPSVYYEINC